MDNGVRPEDAGARPSPAPRGPHRLGPPAARWVTAHLWTAHAGAVDDGQNRPVGVRFTVGDDHAAELLDVATAGPVSWAELVPHLPAPWCRRTAWYAVGRPGAAPSALTGDEVVGEPPLLHGAQLRAAPLPDAPPAAPVTVRVSEGPDCGLSVSLHPGHGLTVGRSPGCDLTVTDAGLSRHHLTVWTARGGVLVEDASSTNGSTLDGVALEGPTAWHPGVPLRAGATRLDLVRHTVAVDPARPDGAGRLTLSVRPAVAPPVPDVAVDLPELPEPPPRPSPPVLSWAIPLVVSGLLALLLRMPMLLLFGVMAPALTLGSYLSERRRHRAETRRAREKYRTDLRRARSDTDAAVAAEHRVRRDRTPDLAELRARVCQRPTSGVWSRAPDQVLVRLGTADQPSRVRVAGQPITLADAPLEIDPRGGVAIIGPATAARGLARSLVCQLLVQHRPGDVVVVPPTCPRGERTWDWLDWAPHLVAEPAADPAADLRDPAPPTGTVVLVEDHHLGPGTRAAPVRPPEGLLPVVLVGPSEPAPPLATMVRIRSDGRLEVTGAVSASSVRGDLIGTRCARDITRGLASLRVAQGPVEAGIPDEVHFAQVDPAASATDLVQRWRSAPRSTRFVLGLGEGGPCELDLVADGPHALVGGTTGSGKSELLRTLVTSLALANRPDELVFVLVDYKGGSAFAEAAQLPHTVGLITDLDPHLADRALTSLGAELKRRERLLGAVAARDLAEYQARGGPPLARLVLVIDEFRALAEELPTFLDGLVRIAALGRSLGVHLVLATQRPGGIVSADVRANVNLRIALRVRDAADSHDVIDSAAAASLPERLPGRALVRTGARPPRPVQVARVSEPTAPRHVGTERIRVCRVGGPLEVGPRAAAVRSTESTGSDSQLSRLSAQAREAADRLSCTAPPSPWLRPLPDVLPLAELPPPQRAGQSSSTAVAFALADLPAEQEQRATTWDPVTDGHLAVVGAPRTGRSSLLRTLVAGLLEGAGAGDVQLYGFDPAGALGPLARLPQTGAWVGPDDVPRGLRVLEVLADTVNRRQQELAAAGFTSIGEQREASLRADRPADDRDSGTDAGPGALPVVCLVLDGWTRFLEDYGEVDRGRGSELVTQILREGPSAGVVALLTGDRTLLTSRVAPLLGSTWCLRMSDPQDLLMTGLTRRQVPERMPPGRMIRLVDGTVAQAAVLGTEPAGEAQVRELGSLLDRLVVQPVARPRGRPPAYVRPLPRQVALADLLPAATQGAGSSTGLLVGVGGDDAGPCTVPIDTAGGGTVLVSGPPGSGRTTTLRTLLDAARRAGRPTLFVDGDRALRDPDGALADVRAAAGSTGTVAGRGLVVAVDGAAQVADGPVEDALLELARGLPATDGALLVSGEPEELAGSYRGLAPLATRNRTGILLQPTTPSDGAPLGVSTGVPGLAVPGRGLLVVRGRATVLQVALPTPPPSAGLSPADPSR